MKTIKQIADELGVSKDKVKYRVRKLHPNYLKIVDDVTYVNDKGIAEIRALIDGNSEGTKGGEPPGITHHVSTLMLEVLKAELEAKNRQIDELTATNRELSTALAAIHAVNAAATKQPLIEEEAKPRERGIFARIFGKRTPQNFT